MQKSTMKKSIIFLVSALLSVGTIQAAESITKCYGQDATMTASSGDSYQWYKDGVIINGATNQTYTAVDLKASATYTCEVTTNGTSTNTGNLITLGGFEFPAKKPTLEEENKLGDLIDYEYLNFDNKGVNIGIGACTTAKNANDVKTAYFSDLKPHSGDYLLVCDGASNPDARVWSARNLKLKGGVEYQFSCWAANIDKEYALHGAKSLPKLKFVIENETGEHTLLEFTASTTLSEWNEYKATYTPPKDLNWCHIYIVNYTTQPAGNDFALDDVYFGTVINSAGSTTPETFNVTVYDTFNYKFVTEPVCPGTQATITTTLVPAHGGTLEPAANYKYEWKENGKTPVVSTSKDLVVTAPNSVGTFSYVLSTSSSVCYTSGAKSQTISIDTRKSDCGTTATATKGYTPCSGTTCTLEPKSTFTTGTVTWKDASGSVITDLNISITSLTPLVYTCIIETTAANGTPHTITETHTITPQDCGKEETINHPAVTYCTNQIVTLTCDNTGSSVVWDHDPSLTDTEITVTSNSAVGETDTYKCTITTTDNGNTITYIETFTVKTKDCSILVESTMCNTSADSTLKASKTGTNYEYHWTLANGNTRTTTTDTIEIKPTNVNIGDVLKYSCKIYEIPNSNPAPNAPLAGLPPMLLGTDNYEVTITDCNVETDDEEELQTKEDGSIRLFVPEANRCNGCTYTWYKRNADGTKGEPVVKNAGEQDWEHTVYNATEEEYVCEITSNGYRHVQSFKIKVYTPSTSKSCYNAESQEEQKETITGLPQGDRDEYEWYWMKDNQEIPFPEGSISTENNIITLNEDYFVQNGNANYPIIVHIVEKYSHKLEIKSNDTQKEENSTDILPDTENTEDTEDTGNTNTTPINRVPGSGPTISTAPTVSTKSFDVNISSSKLSKNTPRSNDSTFTYNYQIVDKASGETIDVADVFVVNPKCKYNETFPAKSAGMSSHDCNVRLTDKGINGCTAYKGDDPNNKYFIEVDGGDTAGPVFSIKQPGKLIKGKKYLLTFLVRETSTTSGNPPTTNPAKIDFKITINGQRYGITNEITITNQEWERREFNYIALDDEEEVIITVSNFTTSSGHNDFAIDDITFTLQEDIASRNALALRNATAYNNDEVVDEDGDGYVMWRAEHIHYIYPETTQTIVESSSPNVEFEKEITLPSGDQINFRYDPSIYDGVMTQYQDNTYKEDEHGCKHYAYFTLNLIELTPDLFFSPNGDGVHDKWMVEGIETAPNAHIMIYDRHSKLLYKTVASEFEGWDGTYNEKNMVQDDYWYVILVPETNETLSGHFTLKR